MDALECPEQDLCFKWASVYYNISKSFHHMHKLIIVNLEIGRMKRTDFFYLPDDPFRKADDVVFSQQVKPSLETYE